MSNSSLQRLLQCVPPDTFNLANAFLDDIESIRFDSITRHRTMTVLPIAMLPEDKYPKKFLPPQQEFIPHVLSRPVLTSHEATPTFIQYASLLVNFVHKNIPLFARAMAVRMDKGDSHYLIYSVIPGLFGFFISHDHTSRAVEFYKAIMKIVPPDMASEIMKPFFTSVVTYRFIESVMYPFIYRFSSDPKIVQQINMKNSINSSSTNKLQIKSKNKIKSSQSCNDDEKFGFFSYFKRKARNSFSSDSTSFSVIFSYAKMLCDLIIQSIPLLPVEALELIDLMYQRHWTQIEFNDFFFDHFFSYVSSLYLCASPCLRADPVFKDVLNCLKSSSLLNPKFFHKAYFEGLTRYEVPPLYSMLDLPYLDFALTIADVAVATNAIENICELPPSLKGISYSKFSKDKFFKMFAVRSFVRKYQVSELCLTISPTQLANENSKKRKKKKNDNENENESSSSDQIYNFDDYDFGGCYSNSYYNLETNPTSHPRKVDYNKEKSEMVVFNIKRLEVEDNPEFERIFLQEHFSAENEEKSANDITIDLIERIGPDACNFNTFNSTDKSKQQQQQQNLNQASSFHVDDLNENEDKKLSLSENSEKVGDLNDTLNNILKNSPSNEDLTIGRLAKEMDAEIKHVSSTFDMEQIARSQYGNNIITISKMLNEDQSAEMISHDPSTTSHNNSSNNNTTETNKRARKRFNSLVTFSNVGALGLKENDDDDDDCFTHDGITTTFSSQIKAAAAAQTNACELSALPLDVDSLSGITSSLPVSLTAAMIDTQKVGEFDNKESNENKKVKKGQNDTQKETNLNLNSSSSSSSLTSTSSSSYSSSRDKKDTDLELRIYLAKRRANLLIDQSHVFENYIRFRLASEQYSSFTSLLDDLETIICAPLAMNLATFARQQQGTVSEAYCKVEKFFDTSNLKRLIFFIVLSRGPKKLLSSLNVISIVNSCDNAARIATEKLLKSLDISCETNKLHHGESEIFWRTVEALQVMRSEIPVAMQMEAFNYVLGSLRSVEESLKMRKRKNQNLEKNLPKGGNKNINFILKGNLAEENDNDLDFESLLFMAFLTSGCEILLTRYVVFQHFVEKESQLFANILGEDCQMNWLDFGIFLGHLININEMNNLKNELDKLKKQLDSVDIM